MATPNEPIRVGIIGQGRSGYSIHGDALRNLPKKYRIVAVMDPIEARAAEVAAEFECNAYTDARDLIADGQVELVIVASTNAMHTPQSIMALEAGKHVVCEKPVGLTELDLDAMIAASQKSASLLAPFQQRRLDPTFQKVCEVANSGLLGKILLVRATMCSFKRRWDWQTLQEFDGGALNNNAPHMIDQMVDFYNEDELEVICERKRCLCSGDGEDHLSITMPGRRGPTVQMEVSDVYAFPQDRWLICGASGGLTGSDKQLNWKWVDWSTMPERPVSRKPTADRSYNSEELTWHEDQWELTDTTDPKYAFYDHLFESIRNSKPLVITPESIRPRMQVMEACRRSPVIDLKG